MRVIGIDCALARCSVAALDGGRVVAECHHDADRGHAALVPVIVQHVLAITGRAHSWFDLVAVTVGPGSFTGIRAGLAFAHGLVLAADLPLIGVRVSEALAEAVGPLDGRPIWTVIDNHRGRVFLDREGVLASVPLAACPDPSGPIAVAGDAGAAVAAVLAARGHDVILTEARLPEARHVAVVGRRRFAGELPPLSARPLYVDAPEARPPPGGLRAPPRP